MNCFLNVKWILEEILTSLQRGISLSWTFKLRQLSIIPSFKLIHAFRKGLINWSSWHWISASFLPLNVHKTVSSLFENSPYPLNDDKGTFNRSKSNVISFQSFLSGFCSSIVFFMLMRFLRDFLLRWNSFLFPFCLQCMLTSEFRLISMHIANLPFLFRHLILFSHVQGKT